MLSVVLALVPIVIAFSVGVALGRQRFATGQVFITLVLGGAAGGLLFGLLGGDTIEAWRAMIIRDDRLDGTRGFVQPLAEEAGKAVVLLVMLRSRAFRSPVDGLLFGFAAGAGFAAVENIAYLVVTHESGGVGAWLATALTRIPASIVVHGGSSALVGAALADVRWDRRVLIVLGAPGASLLFASWIHGGWNTLLEQAVLQSSSSHAVGAIALLLAVILLLYLVLLYGTEVERRTIRDELGASLDDTLLSPEELHAFSDRTDLRIFAWLRRRPQTRSVRRALLDIAYARRRQEIDGQPPSADESRAMRQRLRTALQHYRDENGGDLGQASESRPA